MYDIIVSKTTGNQICGIYLSVQENSRKTSTGKLATSRKGHKQHFLMNSFSTFYLKQFFGQNRQSSQCCRLGLNQIKLILESDDWQLPLNDCNYSASMFHQISKAAQNFPLKNYTELISCSKSTAPNSNICQCERCRFNRERNLRGSVNK